MARPSYTKLSELKLTPTGKSVLKDRKGLDIGPSDSSDAVAEIFRGNDGELYISTPTAPLGNGPYDRSVSDFMQSNNILGDPAAAIHKAPLESKQEYRNRVIIPLSESGLDRNLINNTTRGLLDAGVGKNTAPNLKVGYGSNNASYRDVVQEGAGALSRGANLEEIAQNRGFPDEYPQHVRKFQGVLDRDRSAVATLKKKLWQGFLSAIVICALYFGYSYAKNADLVMAAPETTRDYVNPVLEKQVRDTYGDYTINDEKMYFMIGNQLVRTPSYCSPENVTSSGIEFHLVLNGNEYLGLELICNGQERESYINSSSPAVQNQHFRTTKSDFLEENGTGLTILGGTFGAIAAVLGLTTRKSKEPEPYKARR